VIIAIGIVQIPYTNRVVRSAVLSLKEETYVEAARAIGCRDGSVMWRHILPNVMAPVIIIATSGLGGAILTEAYLSFLGLGAPPPIPSWGGMVSTARQYMLTDPQLLIAPAVALSVTVLAWNLAGDALRDILDPRLRRR
jgi:peptide/nickel transport system permease protein